MAKLLPSRLVRHSRRPLLLRMPMQEQGLIKLYVKPSMPKASARRKSVPIAGIMWGTEVCHVVSAQFGVIVLTTSAGIMDHEVRHPSPGSILHCPVYCCWLSAPFVYDLRKAI